MPLCWDLVCEALKLLGCCLAVCERCWPGYDKEFGSDQGEGAPGPMIWITGDLKTS